MQVHSHPPWGTDGEPSYPPSTSQATSYEAFYQQSLPQSQPQMGGTSSNQPHWQHDTLGRSTPTFSSAKEHPAPFMGLDNTYHQPPVLNGPLTTPHYAPSSSQWPSGYLEQAQHQGAYDRELQQQGRQEQYGTIQSQPWSAPQLQPAYDQSWQHRPTPSVLYQQPSPSLRQAAPIPYQAQPQPPAPASYPYPAAQPQRNLTPAPQWSAPQDAAYFAPGPYDSFDPLAFQAHLQRDQVNSGSGSDTASSNSSSYDSFSSAPLAYPFGTQHFADFGLLSNDSPASTSSFSDSTFPMPTYPIRPNGPSRTGSQLSQFSSSDKRISASNASTPPNPTDDPEDTLPIVATAAYKRAEHIAEGSPLHYNPARKPPPGTTTDANGTPTKSNTKTIMVNCWTCSDPIAKTNLRTTAPAGSAPIPLEFVPKVNMTCRSCLPFDGSETSSMVERREASYKDTLSAAIDRLQGLEIKEPEPHSPEMEKDLPPNYRKHAVKCDVCNRLVGSGTISAPEGSPEFTIETICVKCNVKYAPCSDCGGGGGRLSPGRWRCIELFPDGRKTCKLSHLRSPPANELSMEMVAMNKIPPKKLDALFQRSRTLYFNTRMATLARPEMLEKGDGLARTFQEAEKMAIDQWNLIRPLFYEDVEGTRGIRRYLLTQSAQPRSRRGVRKVPRVGNSDQDMIITGIVVVEYEFATGSVFYPLLTPWASTGHGYEANRVAGLETLRVLRNERDALNYERSIQGLPPYPPLEVTWIVAPFSLDSKMTQGIERRGYRDFAEFTRVYPETNLNMFPPIREIFIPRQYVKAVQVWACKLQDQQEPDLRGVSKTKRKAVAKLNLPEDEQD